MHIHILGVGSIGSLLALHLRRTLPRDVRITLMLKKPAYSISRTRNRTYDSKTSVKVTRHGQDMYANGFEFEISAEGIGKPGEWGKRGAAQVDILRDLVFDEVGNVRKSFGFNELEGRQTNSRPLRRDLFHPTGVDHTPEMDSISPKSTPISSLIITTKAPSIIPALTALRHRLSSRSTVALLHNGMGIYEQAVDDLFRNAQDRPHFILGTTTHGAWVRSEQEIVHTTPESMGDLRWGVVPDYQERDYERTYWDMQAEGIEEEERQLSLDDICLPSSSNTRPNPYSDPKTTLQTPSPSTSTSENRYTSLRTTLSALLSLTSLNSRWIPIAHLQTQLRSKLVVNCVINPLTAILNVRNGELFNDAHSKKICKSVCDEASAVFRMEAMIQHGELDLTPEDEPEAERETAPIPEPNPVAVAEVAPQPEPTPDTSDTNQLPETEEMDPKIAQTTAAALKKYNFTPVPDLQSPDLYRNVLKVARTTSSNISSMLSDVRKGHGTEIGYLNEYLGRLGRRLGVPTPTIDMLAALVRTKASVQGSAREQRER